MRIAILDPAAGISGDMTLGALLALGVPQDWLVALPGRLGVAGGGVTVRNAVRGGVGGRPGGFKIPEREHGGPGGVAGGAVEAVAGFDLGGERGGSGVPVFRGRRG